MKRILTVVLVLVLVLILAASASASYAIILYAARNGVNVYAEKSTSSQVFQTLNLGDQVLIEFSESGWYAKLVQSPDGIGQTLGWIPASDLTTTPPCEHNWSDWTVTTPATCTQKGQQSRICTKCNEKQTQEIDKIAHSYGEWIVRRAATCTKKGEMFRTCLYCGNEETKSIDKIPHNWSTWTVRREATCTREGELFRICYSCWKEQTQPIDKIPHDWGSWVVRREPTCTMEGEQVHWCKVCGQEKTKLIEKIPHDYGEWTILREPTCVSKGERAHWCKSCNREETEKIAKLPHDFSAWGILVEATDHSSGLRQRICQYCGEKEQESFDPKGTLRRKAKNDAVREIQQLLVDQGYLKKKDVDGSFGSGTETAIKKFQKDYGLTPDGVAWPQTIEALRHEFGPWETVTELSRFSDGEDKRVCTKCGFEEHEITKAKPSLYRGDKGKSVRCVQELLTALGYKLGEIDSSYGGKVEKAWEAFAVKHDLEFVPDRLRPGDLDTLVNTWIDAQPEENWMGQGDKDSPVNLILTITSVGSENGQYRYNWELSNLGVEDCRLVALLGNSNNHDFTENNLVLVLNSAKVKANSGNSRSGSFTIATDWAFGTNPVYVCAVALAEDGRTIWTSNAIACLLGN